MLPTPPPPSLPPSHAILPPLLPPQPWSSMRVFREASSLLSALKSCAAALSRAVQAVEGEHGLAEGGGASVGRPASAAAEVAAGEEAGASTAAGTAGASGAGAVGGWAAGASGREGSERARQLFSFHSTASATRAAAGSEGRNEAARSQAGGVVVMGDAGRQAEALTSGFLITKGVLGSGRSPPCCSCSSNNRSNSSSSSSENGHPITIDAFSSWLNAVEMWCARNKIAGPAWQRACGSSRDHLAECAVGRLLRFVCEVREGDLARMRERVVRGVLQKEKVTGASACDDAVRGNGKESAPGRKGEGGAWLGMGHIVVEEEWEEEDEGMGREMTEEVGGVDEEAGEVEGDDEDVVEVEGEVAQGHAGGGEDCHQGCHQSMEHKDEYNDMKIMHANPVNALYRGVTGKASNKQVIAQSSLVLSEPAVRSDACGDQPASAPWFDDVEPDYVCLPDDNDDFGIEALGYR